MAGKRFLALRCKGIDLHSGQDLPGADEIPLAHGNFAHPAGELGGDVDFRGFDASIAADEAIARPLVGVPRPAVPSRKGGRGKRHDNENGFVR